MNVLREIDRIAERYHTEPEIITRLFAVGVQEGCTCRGALARIRFALGDELGVSESFSADEIAEMLQISVDEVHATIEAHKDELMQHGELVSIDPLFMELLEGGISNGKA